MKNKNTKTIILEKALNLFSEKGYEAVSVAQIADAVGIKAPSLYKHYASKQDIFEAIIQEMSKRYEEQMKAMMLNGSNPNVDAGIYQGIDVEKLVEMGKSLFSFYLHDDISSKFRKMLAIEQYHNSKLAELYRKQYFDAPLEYQGQIFKMFIAQGFMMDADPDIMALHFYAPMYLLLSLCDTNSNMEEEVMLKIDKHIRQFQKIYNKKG